MVLKECGSKHDNCTCLLCLKSQIYLRCCTCRCRFRVGRHQRLLPRDHKSMLHWSWLWLCSLSHLTPAFQTKVRFLTSWHTGTSLEKTYTYFWSSTTAESCNTSSWRMKLFLASYWEAYAEWYLSSWALIRRPWDIVQGVLHYMSNISAAHHSSLHNHFLVGTFLRKHHLDVLADISLDRVDSSCTTTRNPRICQAWQQREWLFGAVRKGSKACSWCS